MFHSFEEESSRDKGRAAVARVRELEVALQRLLKSRNATTIIEVKKILEKQYDPGECKWVVTPIRRRSKKQAR